MGAYCSRRSGKTFVISFKILEADAKYPGCHIPYFITVKDAAQRSIWPALKKLSIEYGIQMTFNRNSSNVRFASGTEVLVTGTTHVDEAEKLRGGSWPVAFVDEAQGVGPHMKTIIRDVIEPGFIDYGGAGQLVVTGTPNAACAGPFYDICHNQGQMKGFSMHHWTMEDNTALPDPARWRERQRVQSGWDHNNPTFLREYFGQWVRDVDGQVYSINTNICFEDQPPVDLDEYSFVLGIDLGFRDPTAFSVLAYSDVSGLVYVVESRKEGEMHPSDVIVAAERYCQQYDISTIVADPGGGMSRALIDEMAKKHGLPAKPAEKAKKADFIALMNDDLASGQMRFVEPACQELIEEMTLLQWDERSMVSGKLKEDRRTPNHQCFTAGHTVLTEAGAKPIEDVVEGDMVLTHRGRYREVTALLRRDYSGPMVRQRFAGHEPLTCTPEHELMGVEYARSHRGSLTGQQRPTGRTEWTRADAFEVPVANAKRHVRALMAAPPLGEVHDPMQAFVDGYYAAEGSCSKSAGGVTWAGNIAETRVEGLLMGWHPRMKRRAGPGDGRVLYVYDKKLLDRYSGTGAGPSKRAVLEHWDRESAHAFLEGYLHGDGHLSPQGIVVSSVSRELAYQVHRVARSLGFSPSVSRASRGHFVCRGKAMNDCWKLHFSKRESRRFIASSRWPELWRDKVSHNLDIRYDASHVEQTAARLTSSEALEASCTVYSLEVAEDHSYTVNGIVAKNCDATLYAWRECRHHTTDWEIEGPKEGTPEWWEQETDRWFFENQEEGPWWENLV